MGKANPYTRMEKIILGKIAEQAVFEILKDLNINYDLLGQTTWYKIDQYDLAVSGHTVDIKSNFIDLTKSYYNNRRPSSVEKQIEWLLKFSCLVPADQLAAKRNLTSISKLFVFSFIEGVFGSNTKGIAAHAFWDYRWLKKGAQKESPPVGRLNIRYFGNKPAKITIYGTSKKNVALIERIELSATTHTKNSFFQVFSVKSNSGIPDGRIEIKSNNLRLKEIIKPTFSFSVEKVDGEAIVRDNNWSLIWLNQGKVFTPGFIDEDNFRMVADFFPRFSKTIEQYQDTLAENYGCKVTELQPMNQIGQI